MYRICVWPNFILLDVSLFFFLSLDIPSSPFPNCPRFHQWSARLVFQEPNQMTFKLFDFPKFNKDMFYVVFLYVLLLHFMSVILLLKRYDLNNYQNICSVYRRSMPKGLWLINDFAFWKWKKVGWFMTPCRWFLDLNGGVADTRANMFSHFWYCGMTFLLLSWNLSIVDLVGIRLHSKRCVHTVG